MLERPDLQDKQIAACVQNDFGLTAVEVVFLPLGADVRTAVFRMVADDGLPYFLKFRAEPFDETSVALPKFLHDLGLTQIIAPLPANTGRLWGQLAGYKAILYPFVEGQNGYAAALPAAQWAELGRVLRKIHTAVLPAALYGRLHRETFSPQYRQAVRRFMAGLDDDPLGDAVARELTAFLKPKRPVVLDLVARAEQLAGALVAQPLEMVVCHSDLHAGNILIGGGAEFYIVDWDEPILAPKERDLMYIGGGLLASGLAPEAEETLFYRGYGQAQIQAAALAYYRYERIIQDIAAYCQELLLTAEGGADRAQSLHYLKSNFLPGQTIDIAYRADRTGGGG